jgi:hypothetical protein
VPTEADATVRNLLEKRVIAIEKLLEAAFSVVACGMELSGVKFATGSLLASTSWC